MTNEREHRVRESVKGLIDRVKNHPGKNQKRKETTPAKNQQIQNQKSVNEKNIFGKEVEVP